MQKSESIKNIGAALATFHEKMGKIKKDATNPFFKSTYASLSTILENVREPLKESGLIYTQFPGEGLTTILIHPASGEWIESEYKIHPVKNDPQAVGSAITYARRYALGAILGLNIETDDDGHAASQPPINGVKVKEVETPKEPLPWLNETDKSGKQTRDFLLAVEALSKGETTIAAIKLKRRVSGVVETNLVRASKAFVNN